MISEKYFLHVKINTDSYIKRGDNQVYIGVWLVVPVHSFTVNASGSVGYVVSELFNFEFVVWKLQQTIHEGIHVIVSQ
jgi:hypothetical protein